jgi:Glycosyltransferase 61
MLLGLLLAAFISLLLYASTDGRILIDWSSTSKVYPRTFRIGGLSSSIVTNATTNGCTTLNQHAGVVASVPNLSGDGEMWCVLDEKNAFLFHHFPHASESLLTCWSWFQRIRESAGGSNMSCGFYLKPKHLKVSKWSAELIKLMGCSVTYDHPHCCANDKNKKSMILQYGEVVGGGQNWFETPDDAAVLRSLLLERQAKNPVSKRLRSNAQHQTITIVNRKDTRRLVNSANITIALQEAYPLALIQTVYLEEMQPMEQFVLWSQQSIVIAPHGAALTNGIFLPPGNASAVIEIFPPHYYPTFFFGNLLRSCGIRRYGYYNNEKDPVADWEVYGSTKDQRSYYRSVDVEPPIDDILGLVRKALIEGEHNVYTSF